MTLTIQLMTILSMIGMGIYLGIIIDTYQRFLKRKQRNKIIVFLWDFFFWLVQALLCFLVLFNVNGAELRLYVILAIVCGFACYQSLFHFIYLRYLEIAIIIIKRIFQFIYQTIRYIIVMPIVWLLTTLGSIFLFIWLLIVRVIKGIIIVLLKIGKFLLILLWQPIPTKWKKNLQKTTRILVYPRKIAYTLKKWWQK
jgi:spore cortex biosynthesis protein YabQ